MSDLMKSAQRWIDYHNARADKAEALIAVLLAPLKACDEAMDYMSEYDIPIMLPTQVKEALQAAKEAGYEISAD